MSGTLQWRTAGELSPAQLTALWNRVYEGYFVPVKFDEAAMARHLRRAEVDLSLSPVAWLQGEACALSLAGRRAERAYVAGFGVAPFARRRHVGASLIDRQLSMLRSVGLGRVQLEVIEHNPARQLYRAAGFEDGRALVMLEGTLAEEGPVSGPWPVEGAAALQRLHAPAHAAGGPTWRRELPTLLGCLEHDGAHALSVQVAKGSACLTWLETPAAIAWLDAAASDDESAQALLRAMAHRHAGRMARLVDEPEGSPLARALRAAGWKTGLRQVEMACGLA